MERDRGADGEYSCSLNDIHVICSKQYGTVSVCSDGCTHLIQVCILQMLHELGRDDSFRTYDIHHVVKLTLLLLFVIERPKFIRKNQFTHILLFRL